MKLALAAVVLLCGSMVMGENAEKPPTEEEWGAELLEACMENPDLPICKIHTALLNAYNTQQGEERDGMEKRKSPFMRFGKRKSPFMRFGKRKSPFMRFGRGMEEEMEGIPEEKRKGTLLRFG